MKQFGEYVLDPANQCLSRGGLPIELAPKPFAVLRYLVENPDRLITHDELLDALWPQTYVQPQILRTYILELRKLLGDDAGHPRFIQTIPKRGFRFVAQVKECSKLERLPAAVSDPVPGESEIVGRGRELAQLHEQASLIARGQRSVVFLSGEVGSGKTALADLFCRQMAGGPARVARGQCIQGIAGGERYYPVVEALSQLCCGPDREAACRVLARLAPAWLAHGIAEPAQPPAAVRPENQEKTLGDLCAALEALAVDRPLILVFEDLHWADEPTLHTISALARRRTVAHLMVLATCCPKPSCGDDPVRMLVQELRVRRLCLEIELQPLDKNAVAELIRQQLGQRQLPFGLLDFVTRRSEGNPLFVLALVEHLTSQGFLVRSGSGDQAEWRQSATWSEVEAGVPDQLARMIELEIGRMSDEEQRLLEAGSLMSVAFPAWAVAAALETDPLETEEKCDALARKFHFLVRAGQDELPDGSTSSFFVFAHGLYREVLYRRQTQARRARRHIRIAERLGELFAGRVGNVLREMAVHYEAAGARDRAAALLSSAGQTQTGLS